MKLPSGEWTRREQLVEPMLMACMTEDDILDKSKLSPRQLAFTLRRIYARWIIERARGSREVFNSAVSDDGGITWQERR